MSADIRHVVLHRGFAGIYRAKAFDGAGQYVPTSIEDLRWDYCDEAHDHVQAVFRNATVSVE